MKKLSLVAIVSVLLVLLLSVSVFADTHKHCECGGNCTIATANGHKCDATKEWQPFVLKDGKMPTANGYYYLTEDTTVTAYFRNTASDIDMHICLNGFKLIVNTTRLMDVYIKEGGADGDKLNLSICDCKGTGKIEAAKKVDNNDGGVFWIGRAKINATVNLYGLNVDCSERNVGAKGGAFLCLASATSGTVNVYGGVYDGGAGGNGGIFRIADKSVDAYFYGVTVKNGVAASSDVGAVFGTSAATTAALKGKGGNLVLGCREALLKDCTIIDGTATSTTDTKADGGANIYIYNGAKVTLENTKVSGGKTDGAEDNIKVVGSDTAATELIIKKCEIKENTISVTKATVNGTLIEEGVYTETADTTTIVLWVAIAACAAMGFVALSKKKAF